MRLNILGEDERKLKERSLSELVELGVLVDEQSTHPGNLFANCARFKGKTGKNKKRRVFIFPKVLKTHLLNSNLKFRKKIELALMG